MSKNPPGTMSSSNYGIIFDHALKAYKKKTGKDLASDPLLRRLESCNSPDTVLTLLREQVPGFEESRNSDGKLTKWVDPVVNFLYAFSSTIDGAVSSAYPTAGVIVAGITTLLSAAQGVSASQGAIIDMFERLENYFRRLEIYVEIPPTAGMIDIIVKVMTDVLIILALTTREIKQGKIRRFWKTLIGKSDIEDALRRLDKLTQEEHRMATAQGLRATHSVDERVMSIGNDVQVVDDRVQVVDDRVQVVDDRVQVVSNEVQAVDDRVQVIDDRVKGVNDKVDVVINGTEQIRGDQLQWDIQHWLTPPDPSTNHDFVWEAHQEGTSAWFFESKVLVKWKSTGSTLWIHGKPGSGKSTLLSAIIQDVEGMRAAGLASMAYYYFDFRDVKKQNRYGLLSSLISQLSAKSDSCYKVLLQLYSDNAGTGKPTSIALTKCLKDMLSRPGQGRIYIIIDALDESPDSSGTPSAREQVLKLIEELVDLCLPNIHLCVASRPEIDIRAVLDPLTLLQISLHEESGQKIDIIEYIKFVVHSDRRMQKWTDEDKQLVIDILSDKADGMFRWVVCQIDRLRRSFPASIRSVLDDLPKSLDETYGRSLLYIDEEKREYAQRLFRCLTVSIRPLRVEELAEIFAVRFDQTTPTFNPNWRPADASEAVLSACSSLIAIVNVSGSQVVQFSHFSVKEFLTSERLAEAEEHLSYYHILLEPAHTTLACASLSVLLELDYKIDRTTIGRFPLVDYAARHWIDHAQFRNVSRHIRDMMTRLFDPEMPHFGAWVWLYDIDRHWLDSMSEIHPTRPETVPLYYASLCGLGVLVEQLLVSHPTDVNARGGTYNNPLHAASSMGQLEVTKLLVKYGADTNFRDDEGSTPLHSATRYGSLNVVEFLLDQGVDMNAEDDVGWTALHYASLNERFEIARLLIQCGAAVDIGNNNQGTPLDRAAVGGSVEIVRLLLESGANVNATDKNGLTPLHRAARKGYRESAQLLLQSGAILEARNNTQETPLYMACRNGNTEVSRFLIGSGSDVNSRTKGGRTPLHSVSRYGHLDVARLLIDRGAEVNAQMADRWIPLHFASANGHLEIVELLVQHGAIVDSRNDAEETPLDLASGNGHLEVVRLLIERGAGVFSRDVKGWAPLHKASKSGHLHVVRFLLECGIDVDIRNENDDTSLDLASGSGELDTVRFLMDKGADIHTMRENGWNPLHIASQNGHLDVVRLLVNNGTAIDIRNRTQMTPLALASSRGKVEVSFFLIERGANVDVRDNENWAPLHFASRYGHADMARLLLDRGVDPNIQKGDLSSPLHISSSHGHLNVTRLLVERGARVDIFNDRQETPLDRAAGSGRVEIVRLFVDNGANLHSTDSNGQTPLHIASKCGHLEVVKLLLVRGADVDVLNKANQTAADLAFENNKADVANFLAEYKADAKFRNEIRSTTMDTVQHGADGDGKLEEKASLHGPSEEGDLDLVESLLEQGVDVNGRNAGYETPLHLAALKGRVAVARLLIKRGAQVDSRDKYGWSPLHNAAQYGHVEVARMLIDHGANVNATKHDYWTPIHVSIHNGYPGVVELLLECGADIHVLNDSGQTPYQLSLGKGHTKIADLLRKHGGHGT